MKFILACLITLQPLFAQAQLENVHSILEVYDTETNQREIIYEEDGHFEAPNWSSDGSFFVINGGGLLYKVPINDPKKTVIPTNFANKCNNDHGISPDGKSLVLSHYDQPNVDYADRNFKTSTIYTVPISGGIPEKITEKTPSFWHGWSPDGQEIAYTALRNGTFDIYKIGIDGKNEIRLTQNVGLDDGPDYSHDGKFIYYNSMQSGHMQIWRMRQDGSQKTQLTFDKYSNWFPHPSPDGKKMVFLSYLEDQGEKHPAMKKVALRLYDLETKSIKELFRFTGGQGTINVPSWSPDGKKFAFVSYEEIGQKFFDADRMYLLTDGDMPASAYIDGKIQGNELTNDRLQIFDFTQNDLAAVNSLSVSNSVRRWPNSMSINKEKTFLLVSEQDGPAPKHATKIGAIEKATKLSLIGITKSTGEIALLDQITFDFIPACVAFHPTKNIFALTFLGDDKIVLGRIEKGKISILDKIQIKIAGEKIPAIPHFTWHPLGHFAAITLAGNDQLLFLKYDEQADNKLSIWGNVLKTAPLPGVGYFTHSGDFFILTTINLTNDLEESAYADNTSLLSIYRFDDNEIPDSPRTRANGGKEIYTSPKIKHTKSAQLSFGNGYVETFAISPNDDYIVGLNMQASWLPDSHPGVTNNSSLSLFALDSKKGKVNFLEEYVFDGVLPECIAFDKSGAHLVVANFDHNIAKKNSGGLDFWKLSGHKENSSLTLFKSMALPRGTHYFIIE